MKLSDVIKVWDILFKVMETKPIGLFDLEKAIDEIVGVENDVTNVGSVE